MSRRERKLLRRQGKKYKPDQTVHSHDAAHTHQHKAEHKHTAKKTNKLLDFYEKKYKGLMWITIGLFIISLIIIFSNLAINGEIMPRGVSLKGGVTITVPFDDFVDIGELQEYLRGSFPEGSVNVRAMSSAGRDIGFIVDASDVDGDELLAKIKEHVGEFETYGLETMGSALGQAFFKQTLLAILVAFVLMAIVVFLSFKTFIPGFAVILSAISDIVMTVAALIVFGIRIETAGIAALLMLIGYSVDTDILLTTRVLKREGGTVFNRCIGAMKTGMTMTVTSIVAIGIGFIFAHSETLRQIMLILLIGLFFDIFNTWIQNTGILRLYLESKSKKKAAAIVAQFEDRFEEPKESKEPKD